LPGLTRQSILFDGLFAKMMDARVKLAHDKLKPAGAAYDG
jgi:hypothetical protein